MLLSGRQYVRRIGWRLTVSNDVDRSRERYFVFDEALKAHRDALGSHPLVEKAKAELEQAQSQLEMALDAWDQSVSELWRTSLALTQAQKRVTHAHELLRDALDAVGNLIDHTRAKTPHAMGVRVIPGRAEILSRAIGSRCD